jgi:hypothetical protein
MFTFRATSCYSPRRVKSISFGSRDRLWRVCCGFRAPDAEAGQATDHCSRVDVISGAGYRLIYQMFA